MGDSVHHDIKILGERGWRNSMLNREEWRKLLKEGQVPCKTVEPKMMMSLQTGSEAHVSSGYPGSFPRG
jgi:hypothetical protein